MEINTSAAKDPKPKAGGSLPEGSCPIAPEQHLSQIRDLNKASDLGIEIKSIVELVAAALVL